MKSLVLACFTAVFFWSAVARGTDPGFTVPPMESVAGKSQAEWSQAWWQWAGSFDRHISPIADTDGSLCNSRQSGPVWFLAGTYGTKRTIRTCSVPAGKYIFFPLINYVVMPPQDRPISCEAVRTEARRITDEPAALLVDLDGTTVEDLARFRQATTQCFNMGALAEPPLDVYPSASNGYYVMLKPLEPGTYELNFGGALPGMLQAVTYTLEVR